MIHYSQEDILKHLPHRSPFLFVNEATVLSLSSRENPVGTKLQGSFFLDPSLDCFKGHFPGLPIFPGVLQVESLAQLCCLVFAPYKKDREDALFFLLQLKDFKFKAMAKPSKTFVMEAELINKKDKVVIFKVQGQIDNEIICSGEIWGLIEEKSL